MKDVRSISALQEKELKNKKEFRGSGTPDRPRRPTGFPKPPFSKKF